MQDFLRASQKNFQISTSNTEHFQARSSCKDLFERTPPGSPQENLTNTSKTGHLPDLHCKDLLHMASARSSCTDLLKYFTRIPTRSYHKDLFKILLHHALHTKTPKKTSKKDVMRRSYKILQDLRRRTPGYSQDLLKDLYKIMQGP